MEFYPGEASTWYSEGAKANPTTTTVLADTSAVASVGNYLAYVIVSTDATAVLNVQWRNAANDGNVKEQRLYMAANQQAEFLLPTRVDAASERLRVIPNANVTGNVSASILFQKMR